MLKDLVIQNLILMESVSISFHEHLTIITGESGSGKTAILHALKLLLGQKLDTSLIRRGEKKGFLQALFDLPASSPIPSLLEEMGISLLDSSLLIAREISIEGKSKNWINNHLVSLSFLQKIGSHLLQIVDQHACQELRSSDSQRELVDLFGSLEDARKKFGLLFSELKEIYALEDTFAKQEREKERELPFCLKQLEELNGLLLQEGEEESIFQEYSSLLQVEECSLQIDQVFDLLSQGQPSVLTLLSKASSICKSSETLEEVDSLLNCCTSSLQESLHALRAILSKLDPDPQKKDLLEEKLKQIDRLKKKYGPSIQEWDSYREELKKKIDLFERLEENKEKNLLRKKQVEEDLNTLSSHLTASRKSAATALSQRLLQEIEELNMKGSCLEIRVERQERTLSGEDSIEFWLAPNEGEGMSLVKEHSSGGELSRLLLALKLALATKNNTPTLVFDEIDAGVGGETARRIGEKLKALSDCRQIICITHFPQVACQADLHLRVEKKTLDQRTFAIISSLGSSLREQELIRMLGGEKTLSFYGSS
jgi:DNA repair protein RecN (Recombination protein N)